MSYMVLAVLADGGTVGPSGSIGMVDGQKVRHLLAKDMTAGRHSIQWDGSDENRTPLASGVYFAALRGAGFSAKQRLLLLR